jgi:hypothetical protein
MQNNTYFVASMVDIKVLNETFGYYILPGMTITGFFLNLLLLYLLKNLMKQNTNYKYVYYKTLCEMVISVGFIGLQNAVCTECKGTTYYMQLYKNNVIGMSRIAWMTASFCEVALTLNRYFILNGKSNFFDRIKVNFKQIFKLLRFSKFLYKFCILQSMHFLSISIVTSIFLHLPYFTAFEIVKENQTLKYVTQFRGGEEFVYSSYYMKSLTVFSTLIFVTISFILNILIVYEFKKFVRNKMNIQTRNKLLDNKTREVKFTKITLLVASLYIFTRSCDMIAVVMRRRDCCGDASQRFLWT